MTAYKRGYKTRYKDHEGKIEEHFFDTAQENNDFAIAMEVMPVTDIEKYWWSLTIYEWYRYHNNRKE